MKATRGLGEGLAQGFGLLAPQSPLSRGLMERKAPADGAAGREEASTPENLGGCEAGDPSLECARTIAGPSESNARRNTIPEIRICRCPADLGNRLPEIRI